MTKAYIGGKDFLCDKCSNRTIKIQKGKVNYYDVSSMPMCAYSEIPLYECQDFKTVTNFVEFDEALDGMKEGYEYGRLAQINTIIFDKKCLLAYTTKDDYFVCNIYIIENDGKLTYSSSKKFDAFDTESLLASDWFEVVPSIQLVKMENENFNLS